MNTYRTQFIARCPSDGQRIFYNLEMRSDDTIMVESINGVLEEITDDYQESIAQRLTEAFPRCSIRLHGVHQGIEIVSELPKDNSYLDAITAAPPQASAVDERAEFEAWVTERGVALHYEGDGHYGNATVSRWWEAWQARAALAQKGGAA